eukprot:3258109-Rhodomonas_salina.1
MCIRDRHRQTQTGTDRHRQTQTGTDRQNVQEYELNLARYNCMRYASCWYLDVSPHNLGEIDHAGCLSCKLHQRHYHVSIFSRPHCQYPEQRLRDQQKQHQDEHTECFAASIKSIKLSI